MTIELKTLVEDSNKLIEAIRTEQKADQATVARMEADLAKTLEAKAALEGKIAALETAQARAAVSGKSAQADAEVEVKNAFFDLMRKSGDYGLQQAYVELAQKSFNTATPADGGFAMPVTVATEILSAVRDLSPIRQLARNITVANPNFKELVGGEAASGWTGETGERADTATPNLTEVSYAFGELYAVATATNHSLNDVFFNVEPWLTGKISEEFAAKEGAAFLNGTGTNMPRGILNGNTVATVKTGAAAALGTSPFDVLVDALMGLKGAYRQNASWLLNSATLAALSKVKTQDGSYIFQPNVAAGVPATLLGRPVYIDENMASVAANAKPILIADFARLYTVADVVGMTVITDQVTAKGFCKFYVSKRLGGGVTLAEAGKAIICQA